MLLIGDIRVIIILQFFFFLFRSDRHYTRFVLCNVSFVSRQPAQAVDVAKGKGGGAMGGGGGGASRPSSRSQSVLQFYTVNATANAIQSKERKKK